MLFEQGEQLGAERVTAKNTFWVFTGVQPKKTAVNTPSVQCVIRNLIEHRTLGTPKQQNAPGGFRVFGGGIKYRGTFLRLTTGLLRVPAGCFLGAVIIPYARKG